MIKYNKKGAKMKIRKAFGLDLGTTNSTASAMVPGSKTIFVAKDSRRKSKDNSSIPSVVGIKGEKFLFGYDAKILPSNQSIRSIKRKMGRTDKVKLGDKDYIPEEISSKIIKYMHDLLVEQIEKDEGVEYDRVVITVPADFKLAQKEATRKAAEMAGLEVLSLLEEPTAAAINFSVKNNIDTALFLVFDFGGGTLDISIIEKTGDIPEVLTVSGNTYLGGDNLDRLLAHYFVSKIKENGHPISLNLENKTDANKFSTLILRAEEIKKNLSFNESINIAFYNVFNDDSGIDLIIDNFTIEDYEKIVSEKIKKDAISVVDEALKNLEINHKKTINDITHILMVGGSSLNPFVQKVIKEKYCNTKKLKNITLFEPDTSVGQGAGIVSASFGTIVEEKDFTVNIAKPFYVDEQIYISGTSKGKVDKIVVLINKKKFFAKISENSFKVDANFSEKIKELVFEFYYSDKLVGKYSELTDGVQTNIISPTAKVNKDIEIEIYDQVNEKRMTFLMAKGADSLPFEGKARFRLNEFSTEEVILPLYHGATKVYDFVIKNLSKQKAKVGDILEVGLMVDELSNITLKVSLNDKSIVGEYVYSEIIEIKEEKNLDKAIEKIEDKISKTKDKTEKNEIIASKERLFNELEEAKKNKDDNHFTSVAEKIEELALNDEEQVIDITIENVEDILEYIKENVGEDSSTSLEDAVDLAEFCKSSIKRGNIAKAKESFKELESIKNYIELENSPKTMLSLFLKYMIEMIREGEKLIDNSNDSNFKKSLTFKINSLYDFISEKLGDPEKLSEMSDEKAKKLIPEVKSEIGSLISIISTSKVKSESLNDKLARFKGLVSKA